jgi:hypothetical protein
VPTRVYVNNQAVTLSPSMVIGQGGEAVIYRLKGGDVLKLYHAPDDPVFAGDKLAQVAAQLRLDEQQAKLPAFPRALPSQVVAPQGLARATATGGRIIGYTMPYLQDMEVLMSYADKRFRDSHGIDANDVIAIFRNLHNAVSAIHQAKVVIGDFNDLNVLVDNHQTPFLVDADSMQFARFPCRTFTARFVDPLHCAPDKLVLQSPHDEQTDWYAYATMLFQSLLLLNPYYGGVHRPKSGPQIRGDARVLQRLTVMSPDVIYPKSAIPLSSLPDDVMDYFMHVYGQDQRGMFPERLLDNLRWTVCISCGLWHARAVCPSCAAPGVVRQIISRRGTVTATRLFQTPGQIVFATSQAGTVRYLYHEHGTYKREGDRTVVRGPLDGHIRVRLSGDRTLIARGNQLVTFQPDGTNLARPVDTVGTLPIFDSSSRHTYWIDQGRLQHEGKLAPLTIGTVLHGQTLLWAGEHFGFGFYRAGSLTRGFVFDAVNPGINDSVPLPVLRGTLIDAACAFDVHHVWFMLSMQEEGVIRRYCYVVTDKAEIVATSTADQGDGSWLGDGIRGRMAAGDHLYAATDSGIVRIGFTAGKSLAIDSEFPDTEPFVTAETQLLASHEGILAVSTRTITLLQIN